MDRPIIEFLNPENLEFLCGCADYTSLIWENKTCGFGSIEVHIPRPDKRITHGLIIHLCRDIPEAYGIITTVTATNHETVIRASTLSRVFDWRYLQNDGFDVTLSTSGGTGKLICLCGKYGLIGDNDNDFFGKPAIFSYPDEALTVEAKTSLQSSCLELMTSVAKEGSYCFGCTVENGQIKLFAYPYTDKGHIFSISDSIVSELKYTSSCDSHRNVFGYSFGTDEDGYIYRAYPHNKSFSGTNRRMLNIGRYSQLPDAVLREKAALLTETESVEAKINLPYPESFALGEIVTIKNPAWDFSKKLAVTSVREIWEDKYSCDVTFGFPQETVYRKMLRIYR